MNVRRPKPAPAERIQEADSRSVAIAHLIGVGNDCMQLVTAPRIGADSAAKIIIGLIWIFVFIFALGVSLPEVQDCAR